MSNSLENQAWRLMWRLLDHRMEAIEFDNRPQAQRLQRLSERATDRWQRRLYRKAGQPSSSLQRSLREQEKKTPIAE
jgi:hypothetical protein